MRTALVLLTCCLAVAPAPELKAGDSEENTVQFNRWPYATERGQGCFVKHGEEWVETGDDKTEFTFKETDRTSEYVELYDASRTMWLRLYPDKALWCVADKEWRLLPVKPTATASRVVASAETPAPPMTGDDDGKQAGDALSEQEYDRAIKLNPDDKMLYFKRGVAREQSGHAEAAVADFGKAIVLGMKNMDVYVGRGIAYEGLKKYAPAVSDYRIGVKLGLAEKRDEEELANVCSQLAWLLATCPDEGVRNGNQAWEFAKKAHDLAPKASAVMRTLAAAFAECGDYAEAVRWAKKALAADENPDGPGAEALRSELGHYQKGEPYREK